MIVVVSGSGPWDGPPGPPTDGAKPMARGMDTGKRVRHRAYHERSRRRQQAGRIERTRLPERPLQPLEPLAVPPRTGGPSR